MSPSVAQRRRRRQESVDFHRLWWLLRREAFYQVMIRVQKPFFEQIVRMWVKDLDSREIERTLIKLWRREPWRRQI